MSLDDRTLLGVVLVLIAVSIVWQLVSAVVRIIKFARDQVRDRFWRETDKLTLFITFLLLFAAYGLYRHDQPRTFIDAVEGIGLERLAELLPIAILTGWTLLVGFWFLFCAVMGIPIRRTGRVLSGVGTFLAATVLLTLYSVVLAAAVRGQVATIVLGALGILIANYLLLVAENNRRFHQQQAAAAAAGTARRGRPYGAWRTRIFGNPSRPYHRWRIPVGNQLIMLLVWSLVFGVVGGITVSAVYASRESGTPSIRGVVIVDIAVMTVFALFACVSFRKEVLAAQDAPRVTLHLVDLSLAVSAGAIALTGVAHAPVSLGPVPAWLVAAGPPLIVALTVLTIHVLPARRHTPRWGAVLVVAIAAGLLVGPAKLAVEGGFSSIFQALGLPAL